LSPVSTGMGDSLQAGIPPWYVIKRTRSTQPCIPPGSLNRVPALIGWGKGGNVTSTYLLISVIPCGMRVSIAVRLIANCHTAFTFIYQTAEMWCVKAIDHPVRTNQIPRQIPEQSMYIRSVPSVLMGGILPFGCIFIQLFFILNSIWSASQFTTLFFIGVY